MTADVALILAMHTLPEPNMKKRSRHVPFNCIAQSTLAQFKDEDATCLRTLGTSIKRGQCQGFFGNWLCAQMPMLALITRACNDVVSMNARTMLLSQGHMLTLLH